MAACFCTGRCLTGGGCAARQGYVPFARPFDPWREPKDYATRVCPLCEGKGLNPRLPWMCCPKCKGEKKVPS